MDGRARITPAGAEVTPSPLPFASLGNAAARSTFPLSGKETAVPSETYDTGGDEQDQAEVFDEDNLEAGGAGSARADRRKLDELPDVLDVTAAVGDADDDAAAIAEDLDDAEVIDLESDAGLADPEDDELAGRMPEALQGENASRYDGPAVLRQAPDEAPVLYAGELDNVSRDDADAAALEADVLADDDIADLGYADPAAPEAIPGFPTRLDISLRNGLWTLTRDDQPVHDYGHADRAVHEAAELARELRGAGQPAIVRLWTEDGRSIEVTEDDPRTIPPTEERSAVAPDRSEDA